MLPHVLDLTTDGKRHIRGEFLILMGKFRHLSLSDTRFMALDPISTGCTVPMLAAFGIHTGADIQPIVLRTLTVEVLHMLDLPPAKVVGLGDPLDPKNELLAGHRKPGLESATSAKVPGPNLHDGTFDRVQN